MKKSETIRRKNVRKNKESLLHVEEAQVKAEKAKKNK
jgi:hypothetical protein